MFSAEMLSRMTDAERQHISMLGVQARELKRMEREPIDYPPIRSGLQLACIAIDLRGPVARANHILLFDVGYTNRYQLFLNNVEQAKPIGWTPAMRRLERQVRPLMSVE